MDIFGIGPLEFFLILIVALLVFGPNDMAKAGRSFGRFLRRLVMTEEWGIITRSAREFRHLPNRLMREAGVDEIKEALPDLRRDADLDGLNRDLGEWQQEVSSWTKKPDDADDLIVNETTNVIAPPRTTSSKPRRPQPGKPSKKTAKPEFSWDEPDIIPVEDNKSQ